MAIGIISALEAIEGNARPDDNSVVPPIDRLASLPQALIMQMAQKGQIPKTMVAPVLAKKAENAQLGVQMQAAMQRAQTGGVPPSTVIEKVIAQNATQEAAPAMDRSNVGIASAPMRPDMFRKAGGGIVAFSGEQGSFVREQRFLEAKKRKARDAATFSGLIGAEAYNYPGITSVAKALEAQNQTVDSEPSSFIPSSFIGASTEVKAEPVYDEKTGKVIYPEGYTDIKEGTYPERSDIRDYLREGEKQGFLPQEGEEPTVDQERKAAEYFAKKRADEGIPKPKSESESESTNKNLNVELDRPESEVEGFGDVVADMADKTQAIMDNIGLQKPEGFNPDDYTTEKTRKRFTDAGVNLDLLSDQAKKLGDERLKLDKDKKEALAFFGLEAGLNILAGKDPNALVNIGAGAGKAIAPLRKELTRLKDQHNALRKEENQLARMQSQQDMGIAKFSQERLNDARKSYDANLRNYNTTRAQIATRFLADNSALQRVKLNVKGQKEAAQIKAGATAATTKVQSAEKARAARIRKREYLRDNSLEYQKAERLLRDLPEGSPKSKEIFAKLKAMEDAEIAKEPSLLQGYDANADFLDLGIF